MPYLTLQDLTDEMPMDRIEEALDDAGLTDAEARTAAAELAGAAVIQAASEEVDSYLEAVYQVPLGDPVPRMIKRAAQLFTLERLCRRRGKAGDANPFTKPADATRSLLERVTNGKLDLGPDVRKRATRGAVVSEDMQSKAEQSL